MPGVDERPPVWVGHVVMAATDVVRTARFWDAIGLRSVYAGDDMAIFELRGGTPSGPVKASTSHRSQTVSPVSTRRST
jgi:hypothetical protein